MSRPTAAPLPCRLCATALPAPFLDFGAQPLPDRLIDPASPTAADDDARHPTALAACGACGLIQLTVPPPPDVDVGHGHGVEVSSSLAAEDRRWGADLLGIIPAGERWRVTIVGDAWALAPVFLEAGHALIPLDDASDVDLVVANHAIAHADDLGGTLTRLAAVVRPGGLVAIETHHALGLAQGQSDIIAPVHRTYLSLACLAPALEARGLAVTSAATIDRYGGSLRILAGRGTGRPGAARGEVADGAAAILAAERAAGLDDPVALAAIGTRAAAAWAALRRYLDQARAEGRRVVGYGAASRGIALLNAAGVTAADIDVIVDRSTAKQGFLTPGGRIPIADPARLAELRPDDLLVLAWPLIDEIAREQAGIGAWGGRFVVALPTLAIREPVASDGTASR
jgi:SAM-dependent methyltransferase